MPTEIEIKLEVAADTELLSSAHPWLEQLAGPPREQELKSLYFDTEKLELADHGVSLRVRRVGEKRLQTVKVDRTHAGIARQESETEIEGDVPEIKRLRHTPLQPLLVKQRRKALHPVFATRVWRTSFQLDLNGSRLELAVDRGEIRAGESVEPISELEVELKEGALDGLLELTRRLGEKLSVRYAVRSKAERGYALLRGEQGKSHGADDIALDRGATAAEAFRVIGLSCLRHFALNEDAVGREDSEGVHQMRVGLRRLRAALSLFAELLQDDETETVKTQLRWLTEQLGPARDYDVLIAETVEPLRNSRPGRPDVASLERVLDHARHEKFDDAKSAVASDRAGRIVLSTALWLLGGDWSKNPDELRRRRRERPIESLARDVLTRRTRKIGKRLKKLPELDPLSRHKLRISVKKLHYAAQFFGALFPDRKAQRRQFVKVLKKLQTILGKLNDIRIHGQIAKDVVQDAASDGGRKPDRPAAFAAGFLCGQEEAGIERLVAKACGAARELKRAPRYWT